MLFTVSKLPASFTRLPSDSKNFACFKKITNFVQTLGVSVIKQTEILPFEPDLDYTSVGKSEMTLLCILLYNNGHS